MTPSLPDTLKHSGAPVVTHRWRDLPPASLVWFYTQAIRELGTPFTFTLRFTYDIQHRMMRGSESRRDYIASRIRKALPGIPCFFVIEDAGSEKIHVHGALAATDQDKDAILRSLKKVSGDRRKIEDRATVIFFDTKSVKVAPPNWARHFDDQVGIFGWARYSAKNAGAGSSVPSSPRSLIYRSADVARTARAIHQACLVDKAA